MRRDPSLAVLGLEQRLRNHRHERLRQHRADHVLFRRGKHVDDPVDRLGGGARVQRAEHEVAGFGRGQCEADGLEVAHFADQDVVRVLSQRGSQRVRERQRVRPELALVDEALLRLVHELDRILDRQDMTVFVLVDVVAHRRQRRRLARAGRPGAQDQPARTVGQVGEDLRGVQLFK